MVADDYVGSSGPDLAVETRASGQRTKVTLKEALDGTLEEHEGVSLRPGIDPDGTSIGDSKSQPLHRFERARRTILGSWSAIRTSGDASAAGAQICD